jgi:hypothetical protein
MTNVPKLSTRAKHALDVLADGGRFCHRLETDSYTGFEKWKYRLMTDCRQIVKGVSFATFYELKNMGFLVSCPDEGTSVSSYYKMNTANQPA